MENKQIAILFGYSIWNHDPIRIDHQSLNQLDRSKKPTFRSGIQQGISVILNARNGLFQSDDSPKSIIVPPPGGLGALFLRRFRSAVFRLFVVAASSDLVIGAGGALWAGLGKLAADG